MIILTKLILALTIIFNIFLIFVLLKNKRSFAVRLFVFHIFGILGWTVAIFINIWLESLLVEKLIFAFAAAFLTLQLVFAKVFPDREKINKISDYAVVLIGLFFTVISFFPGALFHSIKITEKGYTILDMGSMSAKYSLFVLAFIVSTVIIFFRKFKKTKHSKILRAQLKYLSIGYFVFLIINLLTNSVLPVFFGIYFFNAVGPVFSMALVGFITYIITRYRFLDVRLIIQRGLIYTVLAFLVIGFYLLIIFILGVVFQKTTNTAIIFSAGLTTLLAVFTVPAIERYFRLITDKIFYKNKYNYQEALRALSEVLNKNIKTKNLLEEISDNLKKILKVRSVSMLLRDQKLLYDQNGNLKTPIEEIPDIIYQTIENIPELQILTAEEIPFLISRYSESRQDVIRALEFARRISEKYETVLFVAVLLNQKVSAIILLGAKMSGDDFTKEDANLIKTFSYQAAVSLEKAKLYEEVEEYSKTLEEKVEQRTAQIAKMQEEQKQMMLDISHNLLTPLTIVKGKLGLLKKDQDDEKIRSFEESIDRTSTFVYDLLNIAELESGQADFSKEQVGLSDLLSAEAEYFKNIAAEKNIKLITEIKPNIIINGSAEKLKELLDNLFSNAIKYCNLTREDKKIIAKLESSETGVFLTIEDNGVGIAKENIPNLFGRFYREKQNPDIKGTGLGLAICKKIVEKHNGEINVESQIGQGSKFIIRFGE